MNEQPQLPGVFGIALLGMLQVLVWGGSFFLMAVMADPIIKETGWDSPWVYGALSLSILVSAFLAPVISRLIARNGGRLILASSGLAVALGLFLMANAHSLPMFLFAWSIIGIGMALGLYEALFACLGALYGERAGGAITGITLISGFATTVTWPIIALIIEIIGWRSTCVAYGLLLAFVVAPLYIWLLPRGVISPATDNVSVAQNLSVDRRVYWLLTLIFALGAVIMTAISVQLISLLQGQGYSLTAAIGLSALLGPSQVGSRVLHVFSSKRHPIWATLVSVVLVAIGLMVVTFSPAVTAFGLALYGAGNGLRAIVRGLLPLALMPPTQYVLLMGCMAKPSLIGQAITPIFGGFLHHTLGSGAVLSVLSALSLMNVVLVLFLLHFIKK